ncbi:MAG: hypothetical protein Q7S92_03445, partial [Candidatus Diapherotrites archaeon]|nr:hypothetical protein [Candidatus Diapherotrites archaeon]
PKMKNGMDSSALQPGEEKTGWVACEINVENDQVTAIYDDAIPIMERSGPNGPKSYGTITIKIVDALVDDVTAIGKLNEFVGNEYTPVDVKINSFEYKDNLTGVNLPKLCKQTQFRSSPDTACKALIVNATIKNKSGYNLPITYGVKRFTVILDKMIEVTSIYQADPLQGMEDYEGGANEEIEIYDNQSQLQEYYIENYTGHLSLENFEPGEERTGSLVFLVPKNDELFPNDATNIVFRRYFPFDRTQILIPLNENQETIKELEDIKTHYTP